MKKFICLLFVALIVSCATKPATQVQDVQRGPTSPFELLLASDLAYRCRVVYYPLFKIIEPWTITLSLQIGDEIIDIVGKGKTQSHAEHSVMRQYDKYKALWCGD